MNMARNIALSERAYRDLERLKRQGESFSKVVIRIVETGGKPSWRDSIGAFKNDKEAERIFTKILENRHRKSARGPRFKW